MGHLDETLANSRALLLQAGTERGAFVGQLSASALSTATASIAFALAARAASSLERQQVAERAWAWLCESQNADGGWGDTTDSPSNISTTTLCWVALGLATDVAASLAVQRARTWLTAATGILTEDRLAAAIRAAYGKDHTFSVPILTTCALGGCLGEGRAAWRLVPALPFELAACPHQWFQWLGMPTVSYALPALIAIGQVRHFHRPTRNPVTRIARNLARARTLRLLHTIQPESGGFLEAAPLTSFVAMSLVSMGLHAHPVVDNGLRFLSETVLADGSWPIDTNLDTWLTTLSVNALDGDLDEQQAERTRAWLCKQQYLTQHPYTHAARGGWAWTDLPGGVPDADDTAGALLALRYLDTSPAAAANGVRWLLGLQNRDGGIPTFCRGWGKLPFDRSSPDLTAHVLRAFVAWREHLDEPTRQRTARATTAAVQYLLRCQRADGAWIPLWFGNQAEPAMENPLYGTSRVLRAVAAVDGVGEGWIAAGHKATQWILAAQHGSGGFGAAPAIEPSVEETALAVEALCEWVLARRAAEPVFDETSIEQAVARGVGWLTTATASGTSFAAAPLGLYFAKLWYSERLYPLVFTVSALERARRCYPIPSAAPTGESDACLPAS
ncbi:MAG: squalene--hopene cyclase [Planctomycetes bacterium]|nr:squalene--hopene cyclase [Planctomycetota bacterium]